MDTVKPQWCSIVICFEEAVEAADEVEEHWKRASLCHTPATAD